MQYTLDEIRKFLAEPAKNKDKYTPDLLEELIQELYTDDEQAIVRSSLEKLPDFIKNEGLRISIAVVHLSADSAGKGDMKRLIENIELANLDYRDLLLAYYL